MTSSSNYDDVIINYDDVIINYDDVITHYDDVIELRCRLSQ